MDAHTEFWMEPEDGIDNNENGLIDESVKYMVALADIGQPYTCEQWGDAGISGIPLIVEDTGTIFGWLHDSYNAYPSYAILDHEMRVVDKPWPYGSTDNIIRTLYEECEDAGLCGVLSDSDGDGLVGSDDNCPENFNPNQDDSDEDGIGDLCDDCLNSSGDLNEDGFINITDVVITVNIVLNGGVNSSAFTDCEKSNADFTNDSVINVLDIIQIVNVILGNSVQYCNCDNDNLELNKISGSVNASFLTQSNNLIINLDASHSFNGVQFIIPGNNTDIKLLDNSHIKLEMNYINYATTVLAYSILNQPFDSKSAVFTINNGSQINLQNIQIIVGDSHGREMELIKSNNGSIFQNGPYIFELSDIYPNPFNPTADISFSLSESGYVTLMAYNTNGQHVETIFDGYQENGLHSYSWHANNLPSGVYYIKLSNGVNQHFKKAILLK
jgi:hypothetical protein